MGMDKEKLLKVIDYIVERAIGAINQNTLGQEIIIDYVAIFAKDDTEYDQLDAILKTLGKEVDKGHIQTGRTYLLNEPINTNVGKFSFLKIRKPDPTLPQRGAPDFVVKNYGEFKEKYFKTGGNFTLTVRDNSEMIELKGVDVLVYFKEKTIGGEDIFS